MQELHPGGMREKCMPSTHVVLDVHVVFATKRRLPLIDPSWRGRLHAYLGGAIRGTEAFPRAIGGTENHVHLLLGLRATHRLADVLREIKRSSSQWVVNQLKIRNFAWQIGYGAFAVSASAIDAVMRYIENQEAHHRSLKFEDEYLELLRRSRAEFKEAYLWDD